MANSGASFSGDRVYRYSLWREWNKATPSMVVIGLNPSTADEFEDDPTIRRCIGFAKREGCGGLMMVNLFALRATEPKVMKRHPSPVGELNDAMLVEESSRRGAVVVAAWGVHGVHQNRGADVRAMLAQAGVALWCLGTTKGGAPRHPLYLASETPLSLYPALHPEQRHADGE